MTAKQQNGKRKMDNCDNFNPDEIAGGIEWDEEDYDEEAALTDHFGQCDTPTPDGPSFDE